MYKDKDKQREAMRNIMRKRRGSVIPVIPDEPAPVIPDVIPEQHAATESKPSRWERYMVRR